MTNSIAWNLKLFMAISRTSHGVIDLATPVLAVFLWLGTFPPPAIVVIGFITAFAGYTAVYAWNDLVDHKVDSERIGKGSPADTEDYLDTVFIRHPLAQGLLSLRNGYLWAGGWALVALVGAYILNPVCAFIFLCSIALEAVYCRMARISHLRAIVSGFVKTSGGIAAVFAVDPHPEPVLLLLLFAWLFFWEIGGQNVPADWFDVEEDRQLNFKTIPARFGLEVAGRIILISLVITLVMNLLLLAMLPDRFSLFSSIGSIVVSFYLLLLPAYRLHKTKAPSLVSSLFNRGSFYPLALLMVVVFDVFFIRAAGR
jgi:4-hydroxybenzoate polyprenyltransferase